MKNKHETSSGQIPQPIDYGNRGEVIQMPQKDPHDFEVTVDLTDEQRLEAAHRDLLSKGGMIIDSRVRSNLVLLLGKIVNQFKMAVPSETEAHLNNRGVELPDGVYLFAQNGQPGLDVFGGDKAEAVMQELVQRLQEEGGSPQEWMDEIINYEQFRDLSDMHEGLKTARKHPWQKAVNE